MCRSCTIKVDASAVDAFAGRLLEILNHGGLAMMISVGHRTGLFDAMSGQAGLTSAEIAARAGLQERYVRECLGALVTGGIITYEAESQQYHLPAEHAAVLTRSADSNIASTMQWVSVLGDVEDQVVDCFQEGGGVPYSSYRRFHEVMAEESDQTVVNGLFESILPLVDGLPERLLAGIDVLDVGCGSGHALIALAKACPNSSFVGYDFSEEAIQAARQQASRQGVTNIRFEVQDVTNLSETGAFDLITAFDSIHDQAAPAAVLANIARALRPEGMFLMQDIAASSHVERNIENPLAPFLYTISCMHCMTVSLAQDGEGLGTCWGEELAKSMLADAGFSATDVRRLEHDILNNYYISTLGV